MKLKYDLDYRCRNCGIFALKDQAIIHDSVTCPVCRRNSDFVRGTVWRVEEPNTKKVHKTQKKLEMDAK
jgi:rubredoxin